jgi:hypothetical protein
LRIGTQLSSVVVVLDSEIFILFDEGAVIAALQASGLLIKCF